MRAPLFHRALLATLCFGTAALAQETLDAPRGVTVPAYLDSGHLDNPAREPRTVFAHTFSFPGHAWIRLAFDAASLPQGSFLRITSLLDHQSQELDLKALEEWSWSSAYFNGEKVLLELVAAPGSTRNRVVVRSATTELAAPPEGRGAPGLCGICPPDDRTPSSQAWAGRLLPAGCTASIFCQDSTLVSAGHCVQPGMVVQFNVPQSLASCAIAHPPVADQFPVVHVRWENAGAGADWAVLRTGVNSLGQTSHQRQQSVRPPASSIPPVGQNILVYAFGTDVSCTRSQTQQFSPGAINSLAGATLTFNNDVRPGSSGAALVAANAIVGVVSHCSTACTNTGTRIDLPAFTAARNEVAVCDDSHTLAIRADGADGVPILLTMSDTAGSTPHATPFEAQALHYASITLDAPPTTPDACFVGWTLNGAPLNGTRISFMLTGPVVATARYAPCCSCDWDRSARLDSADFFAFLDDFFMAAADFNHDGAVNSADLFEFLACFFRGC